MTDKPQATLDAPGLCHRLDISGDPHAGPVTMRRDGEPQVPLSFGEIGGREITENITSEDYLVGLVDAALFALTLLRMAHQDQPRRAA